jgi:hypothetical protein
MIATQVALSSAIKYRSCFHRSGGIAVTIDPASSDWRDPTEPDAKRRIPSESDGRS